jgi:hypothetical protein
MCELCKPDWYPERNKPAGWNGQPAVPPPDDRVADLAAAHARKLARARLPMTLVTG